MASLGRVTDGSRDCWYLRFYVNRRRFKIGLGAFDSAAAEVAKSHVEHLIEMHRCNRPPQKLTSRWLETLPAEIYDRIAKCGLVDPRTIREHPRTILAFMRTYIAERSDWKKPENYKQAVNHLQEFLKRDYPLSALTKGDAERWHRHMQSQGLSANTAGQNIKRCRQMMRAALEDGLIKCNPFTGVKIDLRSDGSKNRFIDADTAAAILEACPDQEWRVLFALARYGGLRCPSEVLSLRWNDIAWDRARFRVRSPKTERYGKGERIVPLWPELKAELDMLFEIVAPGTECPADSYVIQTYRDREVNLRATLHSIAEKALIEPWPKPFMALRASRRTELERSGRFANHVLNDWFGHSGAIAQTYYLQTTEDDFAAATGEATLNWNHVDPQVGPSAGAVDPSHAITKRENPGKCGVLMVVDGSRGLTQYTRQDSNL